MNKRKKCIDYTEKEVEWIDHLVGRYKYLNLKPGKSYPWCKFYRSFIEHNDCNACFLFSGKLEFLSFNFKKGNKNV